MKSFFEELKNQAGMVRVYIFRKLFPKEALMIDRLMQDNEQLTDIATEQVQSLFDLNSKVMTLEYHLEDAEIIKENLEKTLKENVENYQEIIRAMEREKGDLEETVSNMEDELNTCEWKLNESGSRVVELEDENHSLETSLNEANYKISDLEDDVDRHSGEKDELLFKIQELEQEIARLEFMNEEN